MQFPAYVCKRRNADSGSDREYAVQAQRWLARRYARSAHAGIKVDQYRTSTATFTSRKIERSRAINMIDDDRDTRVGRCQVHDPLDLLAGYHGRRDENFADAGRLHDLGFANCRCTNADRASCDLLAGNRRAFVHLCVAAQSHAIRIQMGLHPIEISIESIEIDHQCRRMQVIKRHGLIEHDRVQFGPPQVAGHEFIH
ncbi:MAG: hypothetical protein U5O39_17650 [Gammaproteobacteria bacterium]|nr:hypothetical protein [Gammaproteobacteria bacterium]